MHAYHVEFLIMNANIVNIRVEATFYVLITVVSIFNSWFVAAFTVS